MGSAASRRPVRSSFKSDLHVQLRTRVLLDPVKIRRQNLYSNSRDTSCREAGVSMVVWLSTDRRIAFSSISPPPSELVEVSSSVPVALVIRKGRIHTDLIFIPARDGI